MRIKVYKSANIQPETSLTVAEKYMNRNFSIFSHQSYSVFYHFFTIFNTIYSVHPYFMKNFSNNSKLGTQIAIVIV